LPVPLLLSLSPRTAVNRPAEEGGRAAQPANPARECWRVRSTCPFQIADNHARAHFQDLSRNTARIGPEQSRNQGKSDSGSLVETPVFSGFWVAHPGGLEPPTVGLEELRLAIARARNASVHETNCAGSSQVGAVPSKPRVSPSDNGLQRTRMLDRLDHLLQSATLRALRLLVLWFDAESMLSQRATQAGSLFVARRARRGVIGPRPFIGF